MEVKINKFSFTQKQLEQLVKGQKYIVVWRKIYYVFSPSKCYRFYGVRQITDLQKSLVKKGTAEFLTAKEINKRLDTKYLTEEWY